MPQDGPRGPKHRLSCVDCICGYLFYKYEHSEVFTFKPTDLRNTRDHIANTRRTNANQQGLALSQRKAQVLVEPLHGCYS